MDRQQQGGVGVKNAHKFISLKLSLFAYNYETLKRK